MRKIAYSKLHILYDDDSILHNFTYVRGRFRATVVFVRRQSGYSQTPTATGGCGVPLTRRATE